MASNADIELRHAIVQKGVEPYCAGEEESYVLYDAKNVPSRAEAAIMCIGCPLLQLCDEAAQRRRPAWGVWGGRVYGANRKKSEVRS